MSLLKAARRLTARDEDGFAMVVALTVSTIALLLALSTMAVGLSLNESTTRDRRWHTALVVAESGIQELLLRYRDQAALTPDTPPASLGPITGSAAGGTYTARIDRCTAAGSPAGCTATGWLIADSTGSVATLGGQKIQRRVRVSYGPDPVFTYALFSVGDLELKNNAVITGDVFANGNIIVGNNAVITGDLLSSQGWIDFGQSLVKINTSTGRGGNMYSGGNNTSGDFSIRLANGAVLEASAHARRECTPAPALPLTTEKIRGAFGTIKGDAFAPVAPSDIRPKVLGSKFTVCEQRPTLSTLPLLRGWASDSSGVTHSQQLSDYYCGLGTPVASCSFIHVYNSVANFKAAVLDGTPPPGVYYVTDPTDATINMEGQKITSPGSATEEDPNVNKLNDFVLRTTEKLSWGNGTAFYNGPGTALIEILSENTSGSSPAGCPSPPAINIENALVVESTTATSTNPLIPQQPAILWYSLGCIDTKNNGEIPGAAYGSPLKIKNNAIVGYDPRVRRTVGAGSNRFFQATWNEIRP